MSDIAPGTSPLDPLARTGLDVDLVNEALEIYPAVTSALEELAIRVRERCEQVARDSNIRARVQHRVKSKGSLERKLLRELERDPAERSDRFSKVRHGLDVLRAVRDVVGIRVIPYREADREALVERICDSFQGEDGPEVSRRSDNAISRNPDYRAVHCQVRGPKEGTWDVVDAGFQCEIQVVGALAHVYNELEHDIGYKRSDALNPLSPEEQTALRLLAAYLRTGDSHVEAVLEAYERQQGSALAEPSPIPFRDSYEFVHLMRAHFPDAGRFPENVSDLHETLVGLGLDSEASIVEELLPDDESRRGTAGALDAFNEWLKENGHPYRLDPGTSDVLLMSLLRTKSDDIVRPRGRGRPPRIESLARRFREWTGAAGPLAPAAKTGLARPEATWELVKSCCRDLGAAGQTFRLREIVRCVQTYDPNRGYNSIAPVVQGMTCNAPGGVAPPEVAGLLFRVDRGVLRLAGPGECPGEEPPPGTVGTS